MFSTLVAVREEQSFQVLLKQLATGVPIQESKKFGGNSVMLLQLYQAVEKFVPLDISISGKLYCSPNVVMLSRLLQLRQAWKKSTPLDVSISGNDVKPEQLYQAVEKFVPFDVLSSGNDVKLEQLYQALAKVVPLDVLIGGNNVKLEQLY